MRSTRHSAVLLAAITLLYFILPFIHIGLALAGLICMALPFILLYRDRKLSWCGAYCPRAHFLWFINFRKKPAAVPALFKGDRGEKLRGIILNYFCFNLMFVVISSIMVGSGSMPPIDRVRLFIVFQLPFQLPQLLSEPVLPPLLLHLSYRIYSIMTSSLIAGTILAVLYRPRTWCTVCPVNTLSRRILRRQVLQESAQ